ncbi:hypothetical protein TRIP_C20661 [Candidatus Zixiibacteriota bacterium]|nr:hypothetical protein TRIP_C20661 [candidate division Zixibacteria bacterium]
MEENTKEIAALKFIRTGKTSAGDLAELAANCDRLIQKSMHRSLKEALVLARSLARHAGDRKEFALTAYRALARVTHMSGKHREALKAYLRARQLASTDPMIRARIDRALIDVYMYIGDFGKAQDCARRAIVTFKRLKSDADLAQTRVNFGNLLHRRDKHRDAERLYRQAAEYFETTENETATARCYYNRANTLVQLFDFPEAERLYKKALEINSRAGYSLEATDARYGLAWLRMLQGKFHEALLELNVCENSFREGGDPRGEALCILDRAEVYLGLGLYSDALKRAGEAMHRFARLRLRYENAKASLFNAQAAFAIGMKSRARKSMAAAMKEFGREKNDGFLGVVHLLSADFAGRSTTARRYEIKAARDLFRRTQLPLWEAVCDLKMTSDAQTAAAAFIRLAKNPAAGTVPHLYTAWQTALGDRKFRQGIDSEAMQHWRQAARRLDLVRAQLPPLELRGAYTRRFNLPHRRLIEIEMTKRPRVAAVWSEREKTAGLWAPIVADDSNPQRRKVRDSLSKLAAEITALSGQLYGKSGERNLSPLTESKALADMRRQFREELLELEKMPENPRLSDATMSEEIAALSYRLPIIQFHLQGNEIIAFVHSGGNSYLRRFRGGRDYLADMMRRWHFILENEVLEKFLTGHRPLEAERQIWTELGEKIWIPLEVPTDAEKILIIAPGELANLPWGALEVGDSPLFERHHFIHSPSIRHFLAAEKKRSLSGEVIVFQGRSDDLPASSREIESLLERTRANDNIHMPCYRDDWPKRGPARLWHYSGHAVFCADNPFYSYLVLEDGPIFAADFRLRNCVVDLVTLAACRSGEEINLPGEESSGFVRSLLEMGARNIIASRWPVSDETTALWMKLFYDRFFNGDTILDAIRYAARNVRESHPSAYHWAAFALSGAGDLGG